MLKKALLLGIVTIFLAGTIAAQTEKPLPAGKVMNNAYAASKETGKNVFLIFHATWCSWCKRLEKAMDSQELKPIFEKYFVITYLDVLERGEKIAQYENPDGKALMDKLGGATAGIPFYAFINAEGKTLATSNVMPKDSNIGYPGSLEEINAFMKILKTGAPNINDDDYNTLFTYLKKNAPKPIE